MATVGSIWHFEALAAWIRTDGAVTEWTRDSKGWVTAVKDPLETEKWYDNTPTLVRTHSFTYDAVGNVLTAEDPHGIHTFTYDDLNRADVIKDVHGQTLTFTFDAVGNRTVVEDSQGGTTTSTYNAVNLLTKREFDDGTTELRFDQTYTSRLQLEEITRYSDLAGTTKVGESDFLYDDNGRLENIQHKDGSSTILTNLTYTHDLASRIDTETIDGSTNTFTYDKTNQLTDDDTNTYSYDLNGNRDMTGYQTGTGNRMTNDGTYTYTYDDAGNTIKKSKGASLETWVYEHDHRNQLTKIEKQETDGGTVLLRVEYDYDVFGRRIREDQWESATGTVTTKFSYDGHDIWLDLDGSDNLKMRFIRPDGIDQLIARIDASDNVGWYHADVRQSIVRMTDNSATTLNSISYDGFGNPTQTTSSNGDRYLYTGREFNLDTGLQYNRDRYYDSATGRWTTPDRIGFRAGDPNLYRYVDNSPTNALDPMGTYAVVPIEHMAGIENWFNVFAEEVKIEWRPVGHRRWSSGHFDEDFYLYQNTYGSRNLEIRVAEGSKGLFERSVKQLLKENKTNKEWAQHAMSSMVASPETYTMYVSDGHFSYNKILDLTKGVYFPKLDDRTLVEKRIDDLKLAGLVAVLAAKSQVDKASGAVDRFVQQMPPDTTLYGAKLAKDMIVKPVVNGALDTAASQTIANAELLKLNFGEYARQQVGFGAGNLHNSSLMQLPAAGERYLLRKMYGNLSDEELALRSGISGPGDFLRAQMALRHIGEQTSPGQFGLGQGAAPFMDTVIAPLAFEAAGGRHLLGLAGRTGGSYTDDLLGVSDDLLRQNGAVPALGGLDSTGGIAGRNADELVAALRTRTEQLSGGGRKQLNRIVNKMEKRIDDIKILDDAEFATFFGDDPLIRSTYRRGTIYLKESGDLVDLAHEGRHMLDFSKGGRFYLQDPDKMIAEEILLREYPAFMTEKLLTGKIPKGNVGALKEHIFKRYGGVPGKVK